MKELKIKNCGKIYLEDNIKDGIGKRNSKIFLNDVSIEFAKKSKQLFDMTGELIYYYREKQLHSVFVPIIDKLGDAIITEIPTIRNKDNYGWIDYWVKYASTIFLIELKHSYYNLQNNELRDSSLKEWQIAINQINSIKNDDIFKVNNENIIKIALNVITIYHNNNFIPKLDIEEIKDKILQKTEADFITIWIPPIYMSELVIEWKDSIEKYPAVVIIAKVI